MAKNPFFRTAIEDSRLMEDLVIESIKVNGYDFVYIPRESIRRDNLFGEDLLSKFTDTGIVEMYVASFDGPQGGEIFSKFGLEHKEKIKFIVSKKRFDQCMAHIFPKIIRPREGDLIHYLPFKQFFEISFVDEQAGVPFYQGDRLYAYEITAEGYQFDSDKIETGFTEIDNLLVAEDQLLTSIDLNGISGEFSNNERVYVGGSVSDSTFLGTIVNYNKNDPDKLELKSVSGNITSAVGATLYGELSGAQGIISADLGNTTDKIPIDYYGYNDELRKEGQIIIDFSEIDPFSEGNI